MNRMAPPAPARPSYKPWLLLASGMALLGGVTAALALRRRPSFDVTPIPPREITGLSPASAQSPIPACAEGAWRQFWYDRGYRGEPLAAPAEPTDTFYALGEFDRRTGNRRRDVATDPPTRQDWDAAGINIGQVEDVEHAAETYPRRVTERGVAWLVFPVPNPDTREDFLCAMWPCNNRGSEPAYPERDVESNHLPDGRTRYSLRASGELIWQG